MFTDLFLAIDKAIEAENYKPLQKEEEAVWLEVRQQVETTCNKVYEVTDRSERYELMRSILDELVILCNEVACIDLQ